MVLPLTHYICWLLNSIPCLFDSLLPPNFRLYVVSMAQLSFTAFTVNRFFLSMFLGTQSKCNSRVKEKQNAIGSAQLFVPGHLLGQSDVFESGVHA